MSHRYADNAKWPARDSCEVSGLKTTDSVISAVPALVTFLHVFPDGADCEVLLYDNATAAAGTVKGGAVLKAADPMGGFEGGRSRRFSNGVYLKIVSGTPRVLVGYQP